MFGTVSLKLLPSFQNLFVPWQEGWGEAGTSICSNSMEEQLLHEGGGELEFGVALVG